MKLSCSINRESVIVPSVAPAAIAETVTEMSAIIKKELGFDIKFSKELL